jgi:glycosyltransferase involved in cell wall biosynthesis
MLVTIAKSRGLTPDVRVHFAVAAPGRLETELREAGVAIDLLGDVRLSRPASVLQARARLAQVLEASAGNPLVVVCHAPWAYTLFAPVVKRRGIPVVLWQHTHASGRSLIERLGKKTPADLVICNSHWTTGSTAALQENVPIAVIHPPVMLPSLPPTMAQGPVARDAARRDLNLPPDTVLILAASRLEPGKGHGNLIQALSRVADLPGWCLCIAGGFDRPEEAQYVSRLEREARQLGLEERVRFLGELRPVTSFLPLVDILCQANELPDAFGIVFAEALLSGIPVVTPRMGGAPEIVSDSCGRLVPPGDIETLASALRELILDPALRQRLGAKGPAHAAARVAPAVVLPQLTRALESLTVPAVVH